MSTRYNRNLIPLARTLRKNMTDQEKKLWYTFLRSYRPRFQRQKAIDHYIADFFCHQAMLIIEIDGGQHFAEERLEQDKNRDSLMSSYGIKTLRFTNVQVNNYFESVCLCIDAEV